MDALGDFEQFIRNRGTMPALVHCGVAHAQFETIHPFLDGNGRVGRLLVTLLLCHEKILRRPLLYLSVFLKRHRAEYYDRLMAIRSSGDWEGWLKFFVRGVREVSESATETVRKILALREAHRQAIAERLGRRSSGLVLLDYLYEQPLVNVRMIENRIKRTFPIASRLTMDLEKLGILREITGGKRNRLYRYDPYLELFESAAKAEN